MQVDELRQHIKILQAVGYNAMEGEDLSPGKGKNGEEGTGAEGSSARSLEALLLAKNRHLEHELTMARLHVADLTGVLSIFCLSHQPVVCHNDRTTAEGSLAWVHLKRDLSDYVSTDNVCNALGGHHKVSSHSKSSVETSLHCHALQINMSLT